MTEPVADTHSIDPHIAHLQNYQKVMEAAGYVIFVADELGFFTDVSPSVKHLIGYTAEECVGTRFNELVDPEWRVAVTAFYSRQLRDQIQETVFEFPIIIKDGSRKWVEQTVLLLPDEHNPDVMTFQAIVHDISSRKRAEEANWLLTDLVEHSQDFVGMAEPSGEIIYLNQAAQILVGLDSVSSALTHRMEDFIAPQDQDLFCNEVLEGIYRGEAWEGEINYRRFDSNQTIPMQASIFGIRHPQTDELLAYATISRDITDQKAAAEALRASEARYRAIVEDQTELLVRFKLDSTLVFVNEAYCRSFDVRREDVINQPFNMFVPAEDIAFANELVSALNKNRPVATFEVRMMMPDGELRWYQWTVRVVLDAAGNTLEYQAVGRDVHDRMLAEEALIASERRNRALLNAIPDLMLVVTREGTIVEVKTDDSQIWNLQLTRLVGSNVQDMNLMQYFQGQEISFIQRTLESGKVEKFNYQLVMDTGQVVHYDARTIALNDDEVLAVVRDISDIKRAEGALAQRVEQLEALRRVDVELAEKLDVDYVFNLALDAAMRLSGADVGIIGLLDQDKVLRLVRGIGPFDLRAVEENVRNQLGLIARALRDQQALLIEDVTKEPDYQDMVPGMRAHMTLPLISQDHLIGVVSVETSKAQYFTPDIFEFLKLLTVRVAVAVENAQLHHQTETTLSELRTLYNRVSRLEELKTEMIRMASHDLRNPLATISGYLELLKMDIADDNSDALEHIETIRQSVQRMMQMLSGILSLERLEEMVQTGGVKRFDLREKVEQVFQDHVSQAQLKSLNLQLDCQEDPALIEADPLQIEQAIANLVGNGIKYTPEGGSVTVRLESAGEEVYFKVIDTGYGVPEAQQKRLFQPFFRVKSSETKQIEGSGLGLHLVRTVVERFGGRILFESTYGEGSTFGFSVPRADKKKQR